MMTTDDVPALIRWLQSNATIYHEIITPHGKGVVFYTNKSANDFSSTLKSPSQHLVHNRIDLVRKIIRTYWDFRSAVSNNSKSLYSLGCNGLPLKEAGIEPSHQLWNFGRKLRRPFDDKADSLLSYMLSDDGDLFQRRGTDELFQWPELDNLNPYCPLDGVIEKPWNAFYDNNASTPLERESQLTVCPHCLGVLYRS